MEKYKKWGKEILNPEEVRSLANRLYEYPKIAEQLMSLLPESFSQVEKNINDETLKGSLFGIVKGVILAQLNARLLLQFFIYFAVPQSLMIRCLSYLIFTVIISGDFRKETIQFRQKSIQEERKKLEKPEKLARELGNASDDEIHKIIIREIDSSRLKKELHEQGETRMPLEKVADLLESNEKQVEDIEPLIYGGTPMTNTLEAVRERFKHELSQLPEDTVPVLFILSDGMPTDGDPTPIANALKDEDIYIISCFVTNEDITTPRSLFETASSQWNDGAKLMFNIASSADKDSMFTGYLSEHGWKIPAKPKLFVQVNHSEVLNEFIQVVLDPLKEKTQ